jgi:hypothetical protein
MLVMQNTVHRNKQYAINMLVMRDRDMQYETMKFKPVPIQKPAMHMYK